LAAAVLARPGCPEAGACFKKATFVREHYEFFRGFFKRENPEKAEWPDIQKIGEHLHCFKSRALAGAKAFGNTNHAIEHYRKSFICLAHGHGEPAERIHRFCTDEDPIFYSDPQTAPMKPLALKQAACL
jgi:hypothetical protein